MRESTVADIIETVFEEPLSAAAPAILSASPERLAEFQTALRWFYSLQPCSVHGAQNRAAVQFSTPLLATPKSDQLRYAFFERDEKILFNLLTYFPRVHLIDSIQGQFPSVGDAYRTDMAAFSENLLALKPLMDSGALVIRGPCNLLPEDLHILRASATELIEFESLLAGIRAQIRAASQEGLLTLSLMMVSYARYGVVPPLAVEGEVLPQRPNMRLAHVLWQLWTSARMNCSWACEDRASAVIARKIAELVVAVAGGSPAAALHTIDMTVPDWSSLSPSDILDLRAKPAVREWHDFLRQLFSNDRVSEWRSIDEGSRRLQDHLPVEGPSVEFSITCLEQGRDWLSDPSILATSRARKLSASLRFFDLALEDPAAVSEYPRRRMWLAPPAFPHKR